MRLPAPSQLTEKLKTEVERFYSILHAPPSDKFDNNGWEVKGLSEFRSIKEHHKRKLIEKLQAEGKTLEDVITNRLKEKLEQDEYCQASLRKRKSRSASSSSSESSSSGSSRSRSNSPKKKFVKSRSATPELPTFAS